MKTSALNFNTKSRLWTFLFALISGSFITGMTGYVTSGTNYPYVLLTAVIINYLLALFLTSLSTDGDFSLYQRVMGLFHGKTGQFFSSFIGMVVLIILLFVATGENKTAAFALQQMVPSSLGLEYYVAILCILALIPSLFGLKMNLRFAFYLFIALIVLRTSFIVALLVNKTDLPEWSVDNMYNSPVLSAFTGSQGIIYIGFRLAFWSVIALELFNIWSKSGIQTFRKIVALATGFLILTFTIIPGIYIAGIFPAELWKMIIMSEQGCMGDCPTLAIGANFGGNTGLFLTGASTVFSHMLMVSICFLLISRVITHLSARKIFFGSLKRKNLNDLENSNNEYALVITFILSLILSMLNLSASYWVGLSLYLSFGLIMMIQIVCLLNANYNWFENKLLNSRSLCVLTALSVAMMGILFYSSFKDEHVRFMNFAVAIFCFSLWVAASSIVYLIKFNRD